MGILNSTSMPPRGKALLMTIVPSMQSGWKPPEERFEIYTLFISRSTNIDKASGGVGREIESKFL
jgi:hypothetical protein